MSLINDALKRASQAEKARAARPQPAAGLQPAGLARPRGSATGLIIGTVLLLVLGGSAWLLWSWWNGRPTAIPGPVAVRNQGKQPAAAPANPPPIPKNTLPKANTNRVANNSAKPPIRNPAPATNSSPVAVADTGRAPVVPAATNVVQIQRTPPPVTPPVITNAAPPPATTMVAAVVAPAPPPANPPVSPVANVAPPPPKKVEFPPLQVQGIFYRAKSPSALINGRTVFVGDNIGDVKVLAIDQKSVKVELEGATKTLWL
jgi:hypothetical protein